MGTPQDSGASSATLVLNAAEVEAKLDEAFAETVFALGLVRVLTVLPFYDPALEEIEYRLATALESLLVLRRLVADARVLANRGAGSGRP